MSACLRNESGPNWKIPAIRTALEKLGLSGDLRRHGTRRQFLVKPLSIGGRALPAR
jgi:hypothetical protein